MSTPAVIYLTLTVVGLCIALERHGRPRTGSHNFMETLIGTAISLGLMHWGGFFS